jgi:two-component system copper resistance phosphate regulon response regulator CusR
MKFLIVEDDIKICNFLKKGLSEEGYNMDITHSGDEALYLAGINTYDLILLDIMLPNIDGLTFCKMLRSKNDQTPIIILSAKDTIDDKIVGLNEGANDYLAKPFSFGELLARIRVQLRLKDTSVNTKLSIADLELDLLSKKVTRAGKPIKLTAKEFSLLEYMIRHKDQVLSETIISDALSDLNESNVSNIINVYIYRLRNKIDKEFDLKLIKTIRGMGFSINDQ